MIFYISILGLINNTFGVFFLGTIQITTCTIAEDGNSMSVFTDFISSISVFFCTILSVFCGIDFLDPFISIFISLMIFIMSISRILKLLKILMQSVPNGFDHHIGIFSLLENSKISIKSSEFVSNGITSLYYGSFCFGCVLNIDEGIFVIDNCIFDDNAAYSNSNAQFCQGGVIFMNQTHGELTNVQFTRNFLLNDSQFNSEGGIIYSDMSECYLAFCNFVNTTIIAPNENSNNYGASISSERSLYYIESCGFVNNTIDSQSYNCFSGGVFLFSSNATFIKCTFFDGRAFYGGGAVYIHNGIGIFYECSFSNNIAYIGCDIFFSSDNSNFFIQIDQCLFSKDCKNDQISSSIINLNHASSDNAFNIFTNNKVLVSNYNGFTFFSGENISIWSCQNNYLSPCDPILFKSSEISLYDVSMSLLGFSDVFYNCYSTPSCNFTPSVDFTHSNYFTTSHAFSSSNIFSSSNVFSPSQKFTPSFYFSSSLMFSSSNAFTQSSLFTQSFNFNRSKTFTPSKIFTPSNMFSSSQIFTESGYFSTSESFTQSELFISKSDQTANTISSSISTPPQSKSDAFSMSETFTNSNQFTQNEMISSHASDLGSEFSEGTDMQNSASDSYSNRNDLTESITLESDGINQVSSSFSVVDELRLSNSAFVDVSSTKKKGSGVGMIAGIVAGLVAVILLISLLLFFFLKRKKPQDVKVDKGEGSLEFFYENSSRNLTPSPDEKDEEKDLDFWL